MKLPGNHKYINSDNDRLINPQNLTMKTIDNLPRYQLVFPGLFSAIYETTLDCKGQRTAPSNR
jgi:hypothetical protein